MHPQMHPLGCLSIFQAARCLQQPYLTKSQTLPAWKADQCKGLMYSTVFFNGDGYLGFTGRISLSMPCVTLSQHIQRLCVGSWGGQGEDVQGGKEQSRRRLELPVELSFSTSRASISDLVAQHGGFNSMAAQGLPQNWVIPLQRYFPYLREGEKSPLHPRSWWWLLGCAQDIMATILAP